MNADVKIIEGDIVKTEKMKLKLVKEFNDDVTIYENDSGRAVVHFKQKDEYVLISVHLA
jgi:hypothetical protein